MLCILYLAFVVQSSTCLVLELSECFTEKAMSSAAVKVLCSHVKYKCMKLSVLRKANTTVNVFPLFYFGWIVFFGIGLLFVFMTVMLKCEMGIAKPFYCSAFYIGILSVFNYLKPGAWLFSMFLIPG